MNYGLDVGPRYDNFLAALQAVDVGPRNAIMEVSRTSQEYDRTVIKMQEAQQEANKN